MALANAGSLSIVSTTAGGAIPTSSEGTEIVEMLESLMRSTTAAAVASSTPASTRSASGVGSGVGVGVGSGSGVGSGVGVGVGSGSGVGVGSGSGVGVDSGSGVGVGVGVGDGTTQILEVAPLRQVAEDGCVPSTVRVPAETVTEPVKVKFVFASLHLPTPCLDRLVKLPYESFVKRGLNILLSVLVPSRNNVLDPTPSITISPVELKEIGPVPEAINVPPFTPSVKRRLVLLPAPTYSKAPPFKTRLAAKSEDSPIPLATPPSSIEDIKRVPASMTVGPE